MSSLYTSTDLQSSAVARKFDIIPSPPLYGIKASLCIKSAPSSKMLIFPLSVASPPCVMARVVLPRSDSAPAYGLKVRFPISSLNDFLFVNL
jgi:hypothetical protein